MTSLSRACHLWDAALQMARSSVPGDFVECGVWRGGSAGIMGLAIRASGRERVLHLFDSFEGLPEPTAIDGDSAAAYSGGEVTGALKSINQCVAGRDVVEDLLFQRLQIDRCSVRFYPGWFQETIPLVAARFPAIALLRLDGDWYESTKICLDHLYERLQSGGILILDDYYCWQGCRHAADAFRARHDISAPIHRIDHEAVYWIKP